MAIFCSQFSFTSCTIDQAKKGLLIHVVYNEHCPQISVVVQCSAYPEEFHIKQHLKFLLQISDVLCPLHSLSKILVICSTMKTTSFYQFFNAYKCHPQTKCCPRICTTFERQRKLTHAAAHIHDKQIQ